MANRAEYVRTGNSVLTGMANKLSLIPFLGAGFAVGLGTIATLYETSRWLIRGKIGSAATELTTGIVSNTINAINPLGGLGAVAWWGAGQVGTSVVTGHTLGTHARKVTEEIIGSVTGALGLKPQVLASYPAGIGSVPGAGSYYAKMDGPGYWTTRAAQAQGVDPNARYAQYANGEGRDHVEALRNAAMNGPQYRGA